MLENFRPPSAPPPSPILPLTLENVECESRRAWISAYGTLWASTRIDRPFWFCSRCKVAIIDKNLQEHHSATAVSSTCETLCTATRSQRYAVCLSMHLISFSCPCFANSSRVQLKVLRWYGSRFCEIRSRENGALPDVVWDIPCWLRAVGYVDVSPLPHLYSTFACKCWLFQCEWRIKSQYFFISKPKNACFKKIRASATPLTLGTGRGRVFDGWGLPLAWRGGGRPAEK